MKKGDSERNAPLLAATERFDVTMTGRKVEQFEEEFHLHLNVFIWQLMETTEVFQRLLDGEFAVEGQYLRHVTDTSTGDAALFGARLTAKDVDLSTVETATANDAAEQRRLTASASP